MGKRELFIALAFVGLGVAAYHMTAPASRPGQQSFSLARLWSDARRGLHGNAAGATFTRTGATVVHPAATQVRIEGATRHVRVIGENRADVGYELTVDSRGADHNSALDAAKQVLVKTDDLGAALSLRVVYPRGGRQTANLVVRMPSRLGVLVSAAAGVDASKIVSVDLDGVSGDAVINDVSGTLSGTHRNGTLRVQDVGAVKMTLQRARATFANVERGLTLDLRDEECAINDSKGPVDIDELRAKISMTNHAGPVHIDGTDGQVTLVHPRAEVKIDTRRAELDVQLSQAVPLTLLTTDDALRLWLDGPLAIALDAAATPGKIDAGDFDLQPDSGDQESHLTHIFGAGANPVSVSLRNVRGNIFVKNVRGSIVKRNGK